MDDVKPGPMPAPPLPQRKQPVQGRQGQPKAQGIVVEKAGRSSRTPQQARRRLLWVSAWLLVFLPTALAASYYGLIAAPQFATEVRFAVRGPDGTSGSSDLMGIFLGASSNVSTVGDSYILMDYIRSRAFLEKLKAQVDLEKVYNSNKADLLAAFSVKSNTIEDFVEYWRKMIHVEFDATSKIIVVEVKAFDPRDAMLLAKHVLTLSEGLINDLSERARQDALKTANAEVIRMERRLRDRLARMHKFRDQNQSIDPAGMAAAQISRLSHIEAQLNAAKAELAAQLSFMNQKAPAVIYTQAKIRALEKQAAEERSKSGTGNGAVQSGGKKGTLSDLVQDYQALATDLEFAQKAYLSAQTGLEQARINATRQQRYLATFVRPSLPEEAIYPKRIVNSLIIAFFALCLWCIVVMTYYAIRDHSP